MKTGEGLFKEKNGGGEGRGGSTSSSTKFQKKVSRAVSVKQIERHRSEN